MGRRMDGVTVAVMETRVKLQGQGLVPPRVADPWVIPSGEVAVLTAARPSTQEQALSRPIAGAQVHSARLVIWTWAEETVFSLGRKLLESPRGLGKEGMSGGPRPLGPPWGTEPMESS